ncbi:Carbamoyltransferase HypF [Anaerohalosphaera lusitana]|uniref:Carbamoyltransferase n=1 Tax=Anaerohalosphaera lusitana TaxID=1936003 RepID=A0A1U9NIA1_9BACT|nr:carbamoyltransferase HypF [Anaerohalosphaera lusitana]AQT67545.1 Carbamoyltransferase HypF [Anaerohalosphaera lusitana]
MTGNDIKRAAVKLTGRIQGVGCRPFIYRLATKYDLTGTVLNDTTGVRIEIQGPGTAVKLFLADLQDPAKLPPLMSIANLKLEKLSLKPDETTFTILKSDSAGTPTSQVTVDSATCADCLRELEDRDDFRYHYPFINCTNCGPRYSIIKSIPYDRPNTTMNQFEMCPACRKQYEDPTDRRFHAQPVACPACGPHIWLTDAENNVLTEGTEGTIERTAAMLREGKILAIKGLGGFHLACDATNEQAVKMLRRRKQREAKPFAMMAADLETIQKYAEIAAEAQQLLNSPESPIVLLPRKVDTDIAPSIATGTNTLGFMLPYTPLHHMLFAQPGIEVLVITSANISDEPLICENKVALSKLGGIADAFLMHNRDIYRQVDDSVVHLIGPNPAMLRCSRGYAPAPFPAPTSLEKDIFAAGADMKNTFCFAKGSQLILSEHVGDLKDALVYKHYRKSVKHLQQLYDVKPEIIAHDLHPGYFSTQYALSMLDVQCIPVQHHWAHIASVLAEFGHPGEVIGIVADGTGLGTDNAIWGGECLIASLTGFKRFGHLEYFPLPGGDAASKEPIRPILGLLSLIDPIDHIPEKYNDILTRIEPDEEKISTILTQIDSSLNTVPTSSTGRLFDAVAALAGLGSYNRFEAQLPMALEAAIDTHNQKYYDFSLKQAPNGTFQIDLRKTIEEIASDSAKMVECPEIAARFHNFLAQAWLEMALKAREETDINTAALSGGVFCNRYLANRTITLLKDNGFSVLFKKRIPANDGGIALGQAAIAAALQEQ